MKRKLIGISTVVLAMVLLLTLMPSCGNGDEEATPTPGSGVTPTPGTTPTATPEVKTLKIGLLVPFSGAGGAWGIQIERGVIMAVASVNDAGGFKIGGDTYMIEVVNCDSKMTGSVAATCASELVYQEDIHYVVGPITTSPSCAPIFTENKAFYSVIATAKPEFIGPEYPYAWTSPAPAFQWVDAFWRQAYQFHPEIKTVGIVAASTYSAAAYLAAEQVVHPNHGTEIVHVSRFQQFTTDFYPALTPIVAKNPDAISFCASIGEGDLMVKQARELGYTGLIAHSHHGDPTSTIEIAGCEASEGFMMNDPDYSSELYPEATRQLYAKFLERWPGDPVALTSYLGYGGVMLYVQAMQHVNSIDPDEVMKAFNDTEWTFEWFGSPGFSLGGMEDFGIRRVLQDEVCYGEVVNCEKVMMSRAPVVVP